MNLPQRKAMSACADNNYNLRADESAATQGDVRLRGQLPLPTEVGVAVACCDFSRPNHIGQMNLLQRRAMSAGADNCRCRRRSASPWLAAISIAHHYSHYLFVLQILQSQFFLIANF